MVQFPAYLMSTHTQVDLVSLLDGALPFLAMGFELFGDGITFSSFFIYEITEEVEQFSMTHPHLWYSYTPNRFCALALNMVLNVPDQGTIDGYVGWLEINGHI